MTGNGGSLSLHGGRRVRKNRVGQARHTPQQVGFRAAQGGGVSLESTD